jgi:hypothetical protein
LARDIAAVAVDPGQHAATRSSARLAAMPTSGEDGAMESLRKVFWFVLQFFEQGDGPYRYKPMYRKVLLAVGCLFALLCAVSVYFSAGVAGFGALIPVLVFATVSAVCLIVGLLGSERAVSRIWGQDGRG